MIPKREAVIVSVTKIIDIHIKIYKQQTILALLIMVSLAEMVVETGVVGMMMEEIAAADAVDQGAAAAAEATIAGVEAAVQITDVVVVVGQILVNASIPPAILVHVRTLVPCLLRNHTVISP